MSRFDYSEDLELKKEIDSIFSDCESLNSEIMKSTINKLYNITDGSNVITRLYNNYKQKYQSEPEDEIYKFIGAFRLYLAFYIKKLNSIDLPYFKQFCIGFELSLYEEQEVIFGNQFKEQLLKNSDKKITLKTFNNRIRLKICGKDYFQDLNYVVQLIEELYSNENFDLWDKYWFNKNFIDGLELNLGLLEQYKVIDEPLLKYLNDYKIYRFNEIRKVNEIIEYLGKSNEAIILNSDWDKIKKRHFDPAKTNFEINLTNIQIENLLKLLIEQFFIDKDTPRENFETIFKGITLHDKKKIIWLPIGKNKQPNKQSLCELFVFLHERNLFIFHNKKELLNFLPVYFSPYNGEFSTFTYSNLPTDKESSEHNQTLRKIVYCL